MLEETAGIVSGKACLALMCFFKFIMYLKVRRALKITST